VLKLVKNIRKKQQKNNPCILKKKERKEKKESRKYRKIIKLEAFRRYFLVFNKELFCLVLLF